MFVYDVFLVQCKRITKFGGFTNIHGAHNVFRLGKPSFKKEKILRLFFCLHAWASYRSNMIDNWTSALLRERYDAPIQLNHGCLF